VPERFGPRMNVDRVCTVLHRRVYHSQSIGAPCGRSAYDRTQREPLLHSRHSRRRRGTASRASACLMLLHRRKEAVVDVDVGLQPCKPCHAPNAKPFSSHCSVESHVVLLPCCCIALYVVRVLRCSRAYVGNPTWATSATQCRRFACAVLCHSRVPQSATVGRRAHISTAEIESDRLLAVTNRTAAKSGRPHSQ
jgi:hypothetical protein